jgi:hypothetical protein
MDSSLAARRHRPPFFIRLFYNASTCPLIGSFGTLIVGRTKEQTMPTRRQPNKPRRRKPAARVSRAEAEGLALAEELLRASREEQAAVIAESKKFLKALSLEGKKPIGAKKLYAMALREGLNPEGNEPRHLRCARSRFGQLLLPGRQRAGGLIPPERVRSTACSRCNPRHRNHGNHIPGCRSAARFSRPWH